MSSVVIAACSSSGTSGTSSGSAPAASATATGIDNGTSLASAATSAGHPSQYVVGVLTGLSGDVATYGKEDQQGVSLFLKAIGNKLNGRPFVVKYIDTQNQATNMVPSWKRLLSETTPTAVITSNLDNILAIAPLAKQSDIPVINYYNAVSTLDTNPLMLQPATDYQIMSLGSMKWLASHGYKTIAGMYATDPTETAEWQPMAQDATQVGMNVIGTVHVPPSNSTVTPNYTSEAQQIAKMNPDVVVTTSFGSLYDLEVKELRQAGFKGAIYNPAEFDASALEVGSAGGKLLMPAPYADPSASTYAKYFYDQFQKEYAGKVIYPSTGYFYDDLNVLASSLEYLAKHNEKATGSNIVKAAEAIGTFSSVYGPHLTMASNGMGVEPMQMLTVQNGQWKSLGSIPEGQ